MWYNVLFDIVLYIAAGVVSLTLQSPMKYLISILFGIGTICRVVWLRELISEMREAAPTKHTRKKKKTGSSKRTVITILAMELVVVIALYILYSNGVKHSLTFDIIGTMIAIITGLLLS